MSQEQPPLRSRRRQLRQAGDERLEANQESGTTGPGALSDASNNPAMNNPATGRPAGVGASGVVDPGEPTGAEVTGRRRYSGPVDLVRTTAGPGRSSQARARDRATLRTTMEPAEKEGHPAGGGTPTRRQLRLSQLMADTATAPSANQTVPADGTNTPGQKADGGTAGQGGQEPKGMTVEQALAARQLLARQARNQLAKMDHINATDPNAVVPDVLAEQTALAERAAVLNRQTAAGQKLAGQNSQPEPVRNDPSTASNLAMVTPLEFVQMPGVEWPVLKRPPTSHVPIVTTAGPRVEQPGKSGKRPAAGTPAAHQPDEDVAGRTPVAANAAYGLDPLDADTAGLGRVRRRRLVQLAVLALGVAALIAGIMLVMTGLSG